MILKFYLFEFIVLINLYEILASIIQFKKFSESNFEDIDGLFLRNKRIAASANVNRVWYQGVIPYQFEGNFTGEEFLLIRQSMKIWEKSTCIKFVPRVKDLNRNYVAIMKLSCGCCFYFDHERGVHKLSLNEGCFRSRIILHELGHVIGLEHEHIRPDRDENIRIFEDNINPRYMNDFEKLSHDEIDTLHQPYDHDSIMHYPQKAFAINKNISTIIPISKFGNQTFSFGLKNELSEGDIIGTNLLYNCPINGSTLLDSSGSIRSPSNSEDSSDKRLHYQWRIPASQGEHIVLKITSFDLIKSKDCEVDYLKITDGVSFGSASVRHCGNFISSTVWIQNYMLVDYVKTSDNRNNNLGFTATYSKTCSFNINLKTNESITLESPNFPYNYEPNKKCSWCILSPPSHSLSIKFNYFDIESSDRCENDYLRIKEFLHFGAWFLPKYCGVKNELNFIQRNKILIEFSSNDKIQAGGFSAVISSIYKK